LASALAGCGLTLDLTPPDPVPTTGMDAGMDAGPTTTDAGTPPEDAGALDAGTPPEDAGALDGDTPPEDAGAVDSGEGPEDAGPDARDAGPEARDAGPRPIDAGLRCTSNAECSDDILCNGMELCVDGTCVGSGALPEAGMPSEMCRDGADCTEDLCVPYGVPGRDANGCVHVPSDEMCADFAPEAGPDCVTRVCGGREAVFMDNPRGCALQVRPEMCRAGTVCGRTDGGRFACSAPVSRSTGTTDVCSHRPTPGASSDCDDGNPCNGEEQCVLTPGSMGTGHCEPGLPPDCGMSSERCTRTFCGSRVSPTSTVAPTCMVGPDPSCFP